MTNTILLKTGDIYRGNLILVNAAFPVRGAEEPELAAVSARFPKIRIAKEACGQLNRAFLSLGKEGSIVPVSGYRTKAEQEKIYAGSLADNGPEYTKKFVALPDCSEHQTGLAIDLAIDQKEIDFICPEFPETGICGEFQKNAPAYGFIKRYAKEKEQITGIAFEPWHFRYVGYPHSEIISARHFSLEEYIAFIKGYTETAPCIFQGAKNRSYRIFYIPMDEPEKTLRMPDFMKYQISGNNQDGCIITSWKAS